jgi:hypothetical protein
MVELISATRLGSVGPRYGQLEIGREDCMFHYEPHRPSKLRAKARDSRWRWNFVHITHDHHIVRSYVVKRGPYAAVLRAFSIRGGSARFQRFVDDDMANAVAMGPEMLEKLRHV